MPISPLPWKIVRSPLAYYTWIMDATGGCVCIGFGFSDEAVLLAAPILLEACQLALQEGLDHSVREAIEQAVALAKGTAG